ncbi:MAG: hypothetical protein AAF078_05370 [Planctomycetota bacterium]
MFAKLHHSDLAGLRDRIECVLDGAADSHAAEAGLSEWALGDDLAGGGAEGALLAVGWLVAEGVRLAGACGAVESEAQSLVCIGRACWPYARGLELDVARRLLLVDAASREQAVWAAERCLRSGAVGAVVMDGRGLGMTATRRLHLAARATGRGVVLGRRRDELGLPSAASVRGVVRAVVSESGRPRWSVEVLRRKGLRPEGPGRWVVERRGASMVVVVDAEVVDGSVASPRGWRPAAVG